MAKDFYFSEIISILEDKHTGKNTFLKKNHNPFFNFHRIYNTGKEMIKKAGSFKILDTLAEGVKYNAYRAVNNENSSVVLKIVDNADQNRKTVQQLKKEFKLLKSIASAHVIKALDFLEADNKGILVLEDIFGTTLKNYLQAHTPITNKKQLQDALKIVRDIALGLSDIHRQQITHYDINAKNIIYNPSTGTLKLIDFSLAENNTLENESGEKDFVSGTFAYISPEQTGRLEIKPDYRSDFYSFGVTIYELLTGKLPFKADNTREWIHAHIARQPLKLSDIHPEIPQLVSEVVDKLLQKDPALRYQSDLGLLKDIEKCIQVMDYPHLAKNYSIGKYDINQQFQLPQKIYGREEEINYLKNAIYAARKSQSQNIFIEGYSGIGKTRLVEFIKENIENQPVLFVSGKFEQYEQEKPFQAIGQLIQQITDYVLAQKEKELNSFSESISESLGNNIYLLSELAPGLKSITGENYTRLSINLNDSAQRLAQTIEKFFKLFAIPGRPLIIFLDDLQWADKGSLDIIEKLTVDLTNNAFCFIGSFRKEEANQNLALNSAINKIEQTGTNFKKLELKPLSRSDIKLFVSEIFNTKKNIEGLLQILETRTMGNPYFIIEYLNSLYDQKLIRLEPHTNVWTWDLEKISNQDISGDIAGLIKQKIKNLDDEVIEILKIASCFGATFDEKSVSIIINNDDKAIGINLEKAKQESLIIPAEGNAKLELDPKSTNTHYRFIHDKIQSGIYELMLPVEQANIHKKIGLEIESGLDENTEIDNIYELATHLHKGKAVLEKKDISLALNASLEASKRAKNSGALISAYRFCNWGYKLLQEAGFEEFNQELIFEYHSELAETAALNGNHQEMEELLKESNSHAITLLNKIRIHETRTLSLIAQNRQQDAIDETLVLLKIAGIHFQKQPGSLKLLLELFKTKRKIKKVSIKNIADLPPMNDPVQLAIMRSMAQTISVLFRTNPNLFALVVFKLIDITLKHGVAPISPVSFITFGLLTNVIFKDIPGAYELGQLGMKLFEKISGREHYAQAFYIFNVGISPWKEPLKMTNKHIQDAYKIAEQTGDYEYMMSAAAAGAHYYFRAGHELKTLIERTTEQKKSISDVYEKISASQFDVLLQLFTNFIIPSDKPELLKGQIYNEDEMIAYHEKDQDDTSLLMIYLDKLTLAYYFNRYSQAYSILKKADKYKKGVAGLLMFANFRFFESLILLANYNQVSKQQQKQIRKTVSKNVKQFQIWAKHAPMNFKGQLKLIKAEEQSTFGKEIEAIKLYEEAIELYKENGFIHEEALANELCGRAWIKHRNKKIAKTYLNEAYSLYKQWGAEAKALALLQNFSNIIATTPDTTASMSKQSSSTQLALSVDIDTIIDAAKTISSEIVPEELLKKTMTLILEHAGAQKGVLILNEKDTGTWKIEALGYVEQNNIKIALSHYDLSDKILPVTIINSVINNNKIITLNDAQANSYYGSNPYVKQHKIKSLVAIHVLKQASTVGILYLENNLNKNLFTQDKVNVLSILCTQLAISLENAQLYITLEQKVRQRTQEVIKQKEEIQQQATMLETVNKELKTLNHTKDKLFSIIGHDLRNPFNIILGQSDLLIENLDEMDSDDTKKSLKFIENASKDAFQLLQNLLDWSRAQTGQLNFYPRKINLKQAIERD